MAALAADVIMHPVRMRIVATLAGRRLTTQQIGAALPDVSQATLYRHLSRLMKADVIEVIEQRPIRGVVEKVYAVASASAIQLDVGGMTRDDWQRGFAAYTASLLGQFSTYIRQEQADPTVDGVSFRTGPLYLTDEELQKFSADLRAILEPLLNNKPSLGRRRRLISTVLIPDIDIGEAESSDAGESL